MTNSSQISSTFAELKTRSQMAFMPFVTAGDPDMDTTLALIRQLAQSNVDLIEVGFPYSDPIADGPVIQASYTRALENGLHVRDIFDGIATLQNSSDEKSVIPPLVAMVSYSIIFRIGTDSFLKQAREVGFAGLIVPDLPGDEAGELAALAKEHQLDLIQLIAPTTPPERADRILQSASGFVYCISVAGTTGERSELPSALQDQLKWLRTRTELPLAVGFGISGPEQVAILSGAADGVIVGSAIVRKVEALSDGSASRETVLAEVGQFADAMVAETRR